MFTSNYVSHSFKYTSHKTNKILFPVFVAVPIVKIQNSIFECRKNEYTKFGGFFRKITKKTFLKIAEKLMWMEGQLTITDVSRLTSTIKYLNGLSNLRQLNIKVNKLLTHIPKSIGKLTNLKHLNICNNPITHLPKSIGKLSNLITLDLHSNHLKIVPKSIGNLTNLQWLNLCRNQLENIPKSISKLSNLVALYIQSNHFTPLKI